MQEVEVSPSVFHLENGEMTSYSQAQHLLSVLQQARNTSRWGIVIGVTLLGVFLSAPGQAAFFTVNSPSDAVDANPGNGVCETAVGNSVCTLRAAIEETSFRAGDDTIILPPNTYLLTQVSELTISGFGNLTIIGSGASTTIIDGNKGARPNSGVLRVIATSNISGLTIRNGERAQGGGIYNAGTLTLINSTVSGNAASHGGGIYNGSGTLTLTNSTVSGNSAAEDGGGIFNPFFGLTIVTNSTVTGNAASNGGGGIFNDTGILTLTNSTVSGNSANSGGGIYNVGRDTRVFSSTIANNQTGGGVLSVGFGATFTFQNTILASNLPYDCSGIAFISGGNNLMGMGSCTVSGTAPTVGDPQIGPLQNNGWSDPDSRVAPWQPRDRCGQSQRLSGSVWRASFEGPARPSSHGGRRSRRHGEMRYWIL